jgi:predicted ATP-grasp superfamily ATP-dependent carboligase
MSRPDTSVPAVVLGSHHGCLGIARSLGRMGVHVVAVDTDPRAPALASRYVRGRSGWAFGREDAAASAARLLELADALKARPVLVPTSDELALFVAENAAALAPGFRFPRVPPALVRAFSDKRELFLLARRLGVPTPETSFPRSQADVAAFADTALFPVMLKGIDGARLQRRAGIKMAIVRTPAELLRRYDEMEDPAAPNLMLQEYIPGGDDTIWMFNGYFDSHSRCRAGFTGKKLRQHPVHTGSTSLGICLENREVHELTTGFMRATGYRGVLDIGWRFDARAGGYKLLDPNPRIGSTFRLFVDRAGMDVARYLYLDMTGQPLPPAEQREGRKWMVEDRDLESSLDYAREGALRWGDWARSFRGVEEAAWFARDDLRPFVRVAASTAVRGARSAVRRLFRGARAPSGPPPVPLPAPEAAYVLAPGVSARAAVGGD